VFKTKRAKPMQHTPHQFTDNRGFSMVEMILVVAVLGLFLTLSFGTITQFLDRQNEVNEQAELIAIRNALTAYARDTGQIPAAEDTSPATPWYEVLSGYSDLAPEQIRYDAWNQERVYKSMVLDEDYRDTTMPVVYATVFSMGSNREVDTAGSVVPSDAFGVVIDDSSTWWSQRASGNKEAFGAFEIDDADLGIKYTDLAHKVSLYDEAERRLQEITGALSNYAEGKLNEALVQNTTDLGAGNPETYDIENTIFFPPSSVRSGDPADSATYMDLVVNETTSYVGGTVDNSDSDSTRKTGMQSLMRLLGLPDSHCCNPLDIDSSVGERPFYYFSNPRPRSSGTSCGSRPSTGPYLPPRVTADIVAPGGSDVPTCG
jgi:prepilin-type N-terminal cleavage/methylation domain-containing protein